MMRAAAVTFVSKKAIDPLYEKDSLATYTHIESQTVYVCCSCLCRQCTDYLSMGDLGVEVVVGSRQLY